MPYSPVLTLHIVAGIMGILSGTAAMSFRKGSPRHALAGKVFVSSMLIMAAAAVYLAVIKHQNDNIGGGILTFYLILTAWLTAKRRDGETSRYDWVMILIPLGLGFLTWIRGIRMVQAGSQEGTLPITMAFFMGSVLLLAAAGDVRMLLRGGVLGTQRIVRHLWRMSFGLFIATGSFFLGQAVKVFPFLANQTNLLIIPAVLPLLLLVFWLFRVRFTPAYKSMPGVSDVRSLRT